MSVKQPDETLHQHAARELSFILRNRALWPAGFEWDYSQCENCAMGLAFSLGMVAEAAGVQMMMRFNIPAAEALKIFINAGRQIVVEDAPTILPEHIADLLDAYADRATAAKVGV